MAVVVGGVVAGSVLAAAGGYAVYKLFSSLSLRSQAQAAPQASETNNVLEQRAEGCAGSKESSPSPEPPQPPPHWLLEDSQLSSSKKPATGNDSSSALQITPSPVLSQKHPPPSHVAHEVNTPTVPVAIPTSPAPAVRVATPTTPSRARGVSLKVPQNGVAVTQLPAATSRQRKADCENESMFSTPKQAPPVHPKPKSSGKREESSPTTHPKISPNAIRVLPLGVVPQLSAMKHTVISANKDEAVGWEGERKVDKENVLVSGSSNGVHVGLLTNGDMETPISFDEVK